MSLNLASLLRNSALVHPQSPAVIHDDVRLRYSDLEKAAERFAGDLLSGGVKPGDKVALMVPNVPAFTIAYFGVLLAGGVVVPLSTLLVANEVAFQLEDSEARACVVHRQCAAVAWEALGRVTGCRLVYTVEMDGGEGGLPGRRRFEDVISTASPADIAQTAGDDTAVILYTSGTTGKPKGAELTHFGLYYNAQLIAERGLSLWPDEIHILGPGEVALTALPLYHAFGQSNIQNAVLFGGGTVSYLLRFCPAAAALACARDRVTFFAGVPTMYIGLLNEPAVTKDQLSTLTRCVSGGAALPVEVKEEFFKRFGLRIQEGYGLTETSPLACLQRPNETSKTGTIGKPVLGVDMQIVDEHDREVPRGQRGEIVIRGHNIMKGYFKRPEATAEAMRNGWFYSGDIGYIDPEGDFFIVDRKKDMIIRGGYNVYPREVEEALYSHPAVAEAAVIGVPDPRLGEDVKAVVALRPGMAATAEEIIQHCKELVAAYKYPRIVQIIDSLPKGPTGKILKRALRDL
ncbi:MAG TPA: long-chain fatty acid--CoA ligase [Planctomycetaceae bacterium]|jgi:long-chain acyl-CoA synthetase|nr:long-chain fatty acid--CoA ligase [Planctomycetaceae bacterium]